MAKGEKLREWKKANVVRYSFDCNRTSEQHIIDKLEEQDNKSKYLKGLVERDIDDGKSDSN